MTSIVSVKCKIWLGKQKQLRNLPNLILEEYEHLIGGRGGGGGCIITKYSQLMELSMDLEPYLLVLQIDGECVCVGGGGGVVKKS